MEFGNYKWQPTRFYLEDGQRTSIYRKQREPIQDKQSDNKNNKKPGRKESKRKKSIQISW